MDVDDFSLPDLEGELASLLTQIPVGQVTTYGTLALALGDRLASRWVGHFMLHHDHDDSCLCHRVVRSDGSLGTYINGSLSMKARLLRDEGVKLTHSRVNLDVYRFAALRSRYPLQNLRELQNRAAERLILHSPPNAPTTVAGLDISYGDRNRAVGAYVLVEFPSGQVLWSTLIRSEVAFPYIQSFLTFRELPILLQLVEEAARHGQLADTYLIDGSGLLHQRQVGLASHFGVVVGRPTIGVTKKLLCGKVELAGIRAGENRPISDEGKTCGVAIRARTRALQILYVSPGNLVDVDYAREIVDPLVTGHRLPEPLYWADRLSRQQAREKSIDAPRSRADG